MARRKKRSKNISYSDCGLLDDATVRRILSDRPLEVVMAMRKRLASKAPDIREKLHEVNRYLGYGRCDGSDALYIYVQRAALRIDARVSKGAWVRKVKAEGLVLRPTKCWQEDAGWLTGLRIPYDTDKLPLLVQLGLAALRGR